MRHPLLTSVSLLLLASLASAADERAKHVVAPPEDFALLRLPDPADAALRSHTALVPVRLAPRGGRFGAELRLPFDGGQDGRALVAFLASPADDWQSFVATPSGLRAFDELALFAPGRVEHRVGRLPLAGAVQEVEAWLLDGVPAGELDVAVTAAANPRAGRVAGFVAVTGREDVVLETRLATHELALGRTVGLVTRLAPSASGAWITDARLRLFGPDGTDVELPMDERANGEHRVAWTATRPGSFVAQVDAVGLTPEGARFRRTTQTPLTIVDADAELAGARATATDGRLRLAIATRLTGRERVQVGAELWSVTPAGERPLAWIGRIATALGAEREVTVEVGPEWLGDADGRLELRRVRLQDVDTHAVLARAARLPVDGPPLPLPASAAPVGGFTLDRAEVLDPTPGVQNPPPAPPLARGIVLVHGYCSGGVWPAAQFSGAVEFEDFDQNRSHDAFALLLRDQAEQTLDSYGVVGHSQGGSAALHLLTFYESGLDLARGPRLIQSVGTPYQGTPLAGNVSLLGQIFGVGCGENTDLSTDGALLWLANIPSASRARVHHYTTSYTEPAGFFANCNFAANLVLTNPEDGTTEMFRGALPGANDEGHVDGWCHTTGMNDPAQYLDASRNAVMDAQAAR